MRVTWVHPSWRDLVIDHLTREEQARERFLRDCSLHGAQLALSYAGGAAGARTLPLLKRDEDWDALADRVYGLTAELEQGELVALLDAIGGAIGALTLSPAQSELDALARGVLIRVTSLWRASHQPIPLPALEAWLALAKLLSPMPAPPELAVTWVELLPTAVPELADRSGLERFGDWLTLAVLLHDYDPEVLEPLGFPTQGRILLDDFVGLVARDRHTFDADSIEQVIRALTLTGRLEAALEDRSQTLVWLLRGRERYGRSFGLEAPSSDVYDPWRPSPGRLDVQRVLRDL
jgi:hypothetical protein